MRKTIFVKFIQLVFAALVLNSLIFYIVTSSVLLKNTRSDMLYTLETMDHLMDYENDLNLEVAQLEPVIAKKRSRFTIIQTDGSVAADTSTEDMSLLDNHLERKEVADALHHGNGDSKRYSATIRQTMLYVAIRSDRADYILRLAVPYTGVREYLVMLFPAVWLSFLVALMASAFSADKFASSVARPLKEISQEMLKVKGDYTKLSFETCQYPEINVIAETTTKMSHHVKEYLDQIELERQIRQEFFSNASHELKTPITSIQGYAELLECGMIEDEECRLDFVHRIKKEAVDMTGLINDILMISRLETKEAEVTIGDVRVAVILNDILDSLKPLAASLEVQVHSDCKPVCIQANAQQIKELLGNLITNAVKYNKPGGQVYIHVAVQDNELVIRVKDTGMGIPEDSISRVFERFYRVDKGRSRKQGGTGLGLSIVKHIVNFYHGTIMVESKLDVGTEFIVRIPI